MTQEEDQSKIQIQFEIDDDPKHKDLKIFNFSINKSDIVKAILYDRIQEFKEQISSTITKVFSDYLDSVKQEAERELKKTQLCDKHISTLNKIEMH